MNDEEDRNFETYLFRAIRDILTTVRINRGSDSASPQLPQEPDQPSQPLGSGSGVQQRPRSVLTNQNAPNQKKSALMMMITDLEAEMDDEEIVETIEKEIGSRPEVRESDQEMAVIWRKLELPDSILLRIFRKLADDDKQNLRLVCKRWKALMDTNLFVFHRILTKDSLKFLRDWLPITPISSLTVCNLKDVNKWRFEHLKFWNTVKNLVVESTVLEDYANRNDFGTASVGEENMIEVLRFCKNVHSIVLNKGALGNLRLGYTQPLVDLQQFGINSKLWTWSSKRLATAFNTMSIILGSLVCDPVDLMAVRNPEDFSDAGCSSVMLSTAKEVESFSALQALKSMRFNNLVELQIITSPSKSTETIGLVSILQSIRFPQLRKFALHCKEYCPNETVYLAVFNFIAMHWKSLRHLTLTNPILSNISAPQQSSAIPPNLEKVLLKSLIIAWDLSIGLDLHWPLGNLLLGMQRHLKHLELHTLKVSKAEGLLANSYRHLSSAIIDLSETWDPHFDCRCLAQCWQLKILVFHAALTVRVQNLSLLPDTIRHLHWDAYHSLEDVRWFAKYLLLAKSIYLYRDKSLHDNPFQPFDLEILKQFLRLPRLEQLYLPMLHEQDPEVCEHCRSYKGQGLERIQDMFFVDRRIFSLNECPGPAITTKAAANNGTVGTASTSGQPKSNGAQTAITVIEASKNGNYNEVHLFQELEQMELERNALLQTSGTATNQVKTSQLSSKT